MRKTKVPEQPCPHCGYMLSGASDPNGDEVPQAGSPSICINCINVLIFADDMSLRKATDADFAAMDYETRNDLRRYQIAAELLKSAQGGKPS